MHRRHLSAVAFQSASVAQRSFFRSEQEQRGGVIAWRIFESKPSEYFPWERRTVLGKMVESTISTGKAPESTLDT